MVTENNNYHWYAVYTSPRAEKAVFKRLSEAGFETYLPLQKTIRRWSDRKKIVDIPLISSYVFVKAFPEHFLTILQTPGVVRFVYYLGKPAVVKNYEIDALKEFLSKTKGYRVWLEENQQVKILEGPFRGNTGKIVRVGKNRLRLLIESLKIVIHAEVDKASVELIH